MFSFIENDALDVTIVFCVFWVGAGVGGGGWGWGVMLLVEKWCQLYNYNMYKDPHFDG